MSKELGQKTEEVKDESGFYRNNAGKLLHAHNFVYHNDYELTRENKNGYRLPSFGWYWFDTRDETLDYFGIEEDTAVDTKRTYTGEEVKKLVDKAKAAAARAVK